MSMLTELFGLEATTFGLEEVKQLILSLPPTWSERKSYLLHDWGAINNVTLTHKDYTDVGAHPQTK